MVCLVQLKGASDIAHAFAQLAFVVTNGLLSRPEKERLEKHHGMRVQEVLHCEASTPIPDLRSRILN